MTAKAALSIEHPSGQVLYEKEPDELLAPAGLIQLLTTYVARKFLTDASLDEVATVLETDFLPKFARPVLQPGDEILVGDLLTLICLVGHTPASGILGRYTGASLSGGGTPRARFLNAMREQVTEWGWHDAVIEDLSGRNSSSRLSARMIADLLNRIAKEDPLLFHMLGVRDHQVEVRGPEPRSFSITHMIAKADGFTIPGAIAVKAGIRKGVGASLALVTDSRDGTGRTTVLMQSTDVRTRISDAQAILSVVSGDASLPLSANEPEASRIDILSELIGVRRGSPESGAFLKREGQRVELSFVDAIVTDGGESLGVINPECRPLAQIVGSLVPDPLTHIAIHVDTYGTVRIIGGENTEPVSGSLHWVTR